MAEAPAEVKDALKATEPTDEQAHGAVYWLLQPQSAPEATCDVEFDTPAGRKTLKWRLRALPGEKIDKIELDHTNQQTGQVEVLTVNSEIVANATVNVSDETGVEIDINSEEFRSGPSGSVPSAALALEARFHFQAGLLAYLANEVRSLSGWSPDRVSQAKRALVNLAGN